MRSFEYFEPSSLEEAIDTLSKYQGQAGVIAGGTDLLVNMKQRRKATPKYVINIKHIPHLNYIEYDDEAGLRVGALTTIRAIETSGLIQERYGVLAGSARLLGSVQVRNLATLGGNLCNAAPSAEMAPALIGLGAKVRVVGSGGERVVTLEEFFTGAGETVLMPDEVLTEVMVAKPLLHTGAAYLKYSPRKAMDIAVVGIAAVITLADGICRDARVVLGAVASRPIRAKKAEAILRGQRIDDGLLEEVGQASAAEARPITDVRGTAEHRKEMVAIFTRRAVRRAWELAESS